MKRYWAFFISLCLTLFSVQALAFDAPPKPENGWYVLDQAGKLSSSEIKQLNNKIESLNKSTKNEYAVLIVPSLGGADIADAAQTTFRAWGVGKKDLNNGIMVMISIAERKSRIQTGKGVEGEMPDLLANDILKNNLAPHLKRGDFYGGLDETLGAISQKLDSRSTANTTNVPSPSSPDAGPSFAGFLLFMSFIAVICGVVIFLVKRSNQKALQREMEEIREAESRRRELLERAEATRRRLHQEAEETRRKADEAVAAARQRAQELREKAEADRDRYDALVSKYSHKPSSWDDKPSDHVLKTSKVATAPVVAVGVASFASQEYIEEEKRRHKREAERRAVEAREREEREERERQARRKREEEDRARRRREEEEEDRRRSSYSSSSSWSSSDSSSSSWSSSDSSSSGSSWGGGDSGGGGSSGDW